MSIFLWVFFLNQILFFHINLNILKKTLYIYIYTHYGFYFQRLRFVLSLVPFFLFFWQRYARGARFSLVVAPQRVPPFTRDLYPIFFPFLKSFLPLSQSFWAGHVKRAYLSEQRAHL
jgi:hypothetical protein